jgi:NAD(P)-dependent dehydrogenase (short-subunit alcohol dehydrogenase family)
MRIAIVTGGSTGLGRALCLEFENAGYHVIEFSRRAPFSFSQRVDLGDPLEARDAVRASLASVEPTECTELLLISNAGTLAPIGPAWRKPTSDLVASLNTNLTSAILVISEVISHFRNSNCRKVIANISSGAAIKGYAGWSLYCASKAGMEGYIRALAVEEEANDHPFVPVSIDPGVVDTDMQAMLRAAAPSDFPEVERFARRKHNGGLATPESVAAAISAKISDGPCPVIQGASSA